VVGRLGKVVRWFLAVCGVVGALDRLGYFPTAWFSNPISRVVDFLSANSILRFLYLVFPLIMLILGSIILMLERMHSKKSRSKENRTEENRTTKAGYFYCPSGSVYGFAEKL
jgi:hypothetical protein